VETSASPEAEKEPRKNYPGHVLRYSHSPLVFGTASLMVFSLHPGTRGPSSFQPYSFHFHFHFHFHFLLP
jgi:hypothetical protein